MSKLLSISLKKSDISDSLMIQANRSQKMSDSLEKTYFSCVYDSFPRLFQKSNPLPSLFAQLLFFKDRRFTD